MKRALSRLAVLAALVLAAVPAAAQTVGVALAVTQDAFVERDGTRRMLAPRAPISSGDVILTGPDGTVQLAFRDRTRIVVGPDTAFAVDDVTLDSAGRAERFAVTLLGGVFRFLTGDSAKSSYELRTPTATMGIRGTVFDVALDSSRTTRLVAFDGEVRFCSRWNRCARILGGCAMVRTGSFGRVLPPGDRTERDATLNTLFPLVLDQRRLQGEFRARTESCGDVDPRVFLAVAPAPSPLAAPARRTGGTPGGDHAPAEDDGGSGGGGNQDDKDAR